MAEKIGTLENEPSDGDGTDGRFICPYCYDYQGKKASVQAHIRGKTDPVHKGKSGFENESEPAPSPEQHSSEPSTEQDTTQNGDGNDNDAGTISGLVVGAVLALAFWLAKQTGNEDQIEDGPLTGKQRP